MRTAPILVGHDAGGAVTLRVAAELNAPAVVLISPVLPGHGTVRLLLGGVGPALGAVLGRQLAPPSGRAGQLLVEGADPEAKALVPAQLTAESGRLVHYLLRGRLERDALESLPPLLVIGGNRDQVTPPEVVRTVAQAHGGESVILEGGHWLPLEAGWEGTADCVHRWIVRTLGDPLLLLREEETGDHIE
jgi:pimeloyl-ACP methyl ester carboxylesterase